MQKKIKLFVMDVDGTLTDGKINMGPEGELFKSFNIRDGLSLTGVPGRHVSRPPRLDVRCLS